MSTNPPFSTSAPFFFQPLIKMPSAGDSCSSVADVYFITLTQFLAWNPAISAGCSAGFWADYAYCVGTIDTISLTRSSNIASGGSTSSTSSLPISTPNQPNNAISNCNRFAASQSGDWCGKFAERNGILLTQLYAWNAVLGADGNGCTSNFWAGYYYCVGITAS